MTALQLWTHAGDLRARLELWTHAGDLRDRLELWARRHVTRDPHLAADLVGEALLRFGGAADVAEPQVWSYLTTTIRRLHVDELRAAALRRAHDDRLETAAAAEQVPDPAEDVAERAEARFALGLVPTLPPRQRHVVRCRLWPSSCSWGWRRRRSSRGRLPLPSRRTHTTESTSPGRRRPTGAAPTPTSSPHSRPDVLSPPRRHVLCGAAALTARRPRRRHRARGALRCCRG